jgi:hypothetical protein
MGLCFQAIEQNGSLSDDVRHRMGRMNRTAPIRLRRLFWVVWALISVCWSIFIIAPNWSGANLVMPDRYYDWSERRWLPSWGEEHRGCRDRFAFWPDGSRMDDEDLSPPEHQATDRERWVQDVWNKVRSCEIAEWRPIAIQERRWELWALQLHRQPNDFLGGALTKAGLLSAKR